MSTPSEMPSERLAKGVNLIGVVKMLRVHRREHSLEGISPETEKLIEDRVLVSSWYPLAGLLDTLEYAYEHLLGRDPARAIEIGRQGGVTVWGSAHRAYIRETPEATLLGMPSSWPTYFNFAKLSAEAVGERSVEMRISEYPDITEVHGLTIAGWYLAAATLGGATNPRVEVTGRPWDGDPEFALRIDY